MTFWVFTGLQVRRQPPCLNLPSLFAATIMSEFIREPPGAAISTISYGYLEMGEEVPRLLAGKQSPLALEVIYPRFAL